MTASIRNTISTALSAEGINVDNGYGPYVDAATTALTEREYQFTDLVVSEVSSRFGVSEDEVRTEIERAGYNVRPIPEPLEADDDDAEDEDSFINTDELKEDGKKGKLKSRVATLESKVDRLLELAERHLGASL